MNLKDVSKIRGNEEAVKNQYYNYSNPEADTNLDDLANGVSKTDIAYGSSLDPQTRGSTNYTDEVDSGRIMSDDIMVLPSSAGEGGWKSGKKGHLPYMKSIEFGADLEDCPKCEVSIQKEDGKCPICNNSF